MFAVSHANRSKLNRSPAANPKPDEIKAAREAAGLTQTQAGEKVYATLRAWQDYEGGQRRMHPAIFEYFLVLTGQMPLNQALEHRKDQQQ